MSHGVDEMVMSSRLAFRRYSANGLQLHAATAGDPAAPPVVLLHGFPEFWYGWRHQLPALARAGFYAVAPDLPGYNLSDKPASLASYRVSAISDTIAALISALGTTPAHVVGHDWGGVLAWNLAMQHPSLVDWLVVINAPHPATIERALRSPRQWYRSAYMLAFQAPFVPERVLAARDFRLLQSVLRRDALHPEAFTEEDLHAYRAAWAQPGALAGGLNYYRAALRHPSRALDSMRPIERPTLVLWADRDRYMLPSLAPPPTHWVPLGDLHRIPFASHWVAHEFPEYVNRLILDFIGAPRPATSHPPTTARG
jgi:pimeloyl-ACP methyl ester carboxylesterase